MNPPKFTTPPRLLLGIFLISAAVLGFEILAVRLISILFYPIASYLIISLALLGFGVSGGVLALRKQESDVTLSKLAIYAALLGLGILLAILNVWYASQSLGLSLLLVVSMSIPFFFGGFAIASAFVHPTARVSRVYFADLLGAGVGAAAALAGLRLFGGLETGILLISAAVVASALLHENRAFRRSASLVAVLLILAAAFIQFPRGIVPVGPKELAHFVQLGDKVSWEYQGWDPVARIDVLSLSGESLEEAGYVDYKLVTQDGGAPTLLIDPDSDPGVNSFGNQTIFGLPHWIRSDPRVLVIGVGGGPDLLAALQNNAASVIGLEVNPQMLEIVRGPFAEFIGNPLDDPRVEVVLGDGRHFIQRTNEQFDIIQLTGVDTTVAAVGANPNLAENYLYTTEAFEEYFAHLSPDGLLSLSFPNVPGLGLRMLALLEQTLKPAEGASLADHVVVSEITGFIHILAKVSPFESLEVDELQSRFGQHITSVYFPLYNRLFGAPDPRFFALSEVKAAPGLDSQSIYHDFLIAVDHGQSADFIVDQPQTITPPTDDRPFFFVLDKWGENAPNLQTLLLTLVILSGACIALMIVPPAVLRRRGLGIHRAAVLAVYFLLLGLGYIFIEVVFIQRVSLFLGHPSYSLVVTLSTLLIASGFGSLLSGKWEMVPRRKIILATLLVAIASIGASLVLSYMTDQLLRLPLILKLLTTIVLIAVPGFFMGIPFPTALDHVKRRQSQFVPWAWGINGTASVLATILGLMMALNWGFQVVFIIAASLYLVAGAAFRFSEA